MSTGMFRFKIFNLPYMSQLYQWGKDRNYVCSDYLRNLYMI